MSPKKSHKLLVANRSEIACRVFQTAREMGIPTVALCATGDEQARHLTYADQVVNIPSYLDVNAVVGAAQSTGATLIHPGYGFLSERPVFAQAVEKAGIAFVGPTAQTMESMGGKIAAKEIAIAAGVPTLPWARVEAGGDIKASANKVGYPLLLKAAAGGGGKGMRRVDRAEELAAAAESASAEAIASFGDGTLFLERLVDEPRHIEVQVFGDGLGGGVHLYERECSLQRRHQKVWEEARAPHLSEQTRNGLFEAAMRLVKQVEYRSAGTLEFLVDAQGQFYFLEMNTRLQVEHPVTELVTGTDLVWAQLELAMRGVGKGHCPFTVTPSARGHAIEVRIYAEDPAQGFMPTPGKVEKLRWPMGPGIRVDSGIEEGQEVGTSFDSMLGKLIVYAHDRERAVERMRVALEETVILGMGTNQAYLHALSQDARVREGRVYTQYLEKEFASRYKPVPSTEWAQVFAQAQKAGLFKSGASGGVSQSGSKNQAAQNPWYSPGILNE